MRFVQFADSHLDSSISGRLNLPRQKREALREDIRQSVGRALKLASDVNADLLLIPGDLFDFESISDKTCAWLSDAFAELDRTRVFIAPGNHDSLRPGSPYLPSYGIPWPENVHIFRSPEFETVHIPQLECSVTGIAHVHSGVRDRLLSGVISRPAAKTSILLFHGSRDGYRPSDKEVTLPFSDEELLAQGFTYAALGHYHSFGTVERDGAVKAAYSGCVQGRGLDEAGPKHVIVGEIRDGRAYIEQEEVASRRIVRVAADVTGAGDSKAAADKVRQSVDESGARECDIVFAELAGLVSPRASLDTQVIEQSLSSFHHVVVVTSALEPDYDLEAVCKDSAAEGVRAAFVRKLREMADAASDEDTRKTLRDAAVYGLMALDGRALEPKDAD